MFPYILLFGKQVSTYTIMMIVGILISGYVACRISKKCRYDVNDMILLLLTISIGAVIGSHILYGLTNFDLIVIFITHLNRVSNINIFFDCILQIFGGAVFYGGLIGGMIVGYIYLKCKKLPVDNYTDMLAPIIPLFHFFGRIGCFLGGCCYGIESKVGFTYHNALIESANGVNRFPIQLVEAMYNIGLFFLLIYLFKKNKMKSKLLGLYLFMYSVGRFTFEFFRGDKYRGFIFGLSTSQFISIFIFVFSLFLLSKKKINSKKL